MHAKEQTVNFQIRSLTCAAMCLALALVLPFLTGQIPQVGSALLPMHIPVLLAGFLCGPWWSLLVGVSAPLFRHVLFGMPPLITAIAMSAELAAYGFVCGTIYLKRPKTIVGIYVSLVSAMIVGRILWGMVMVLITGITGSSFTWAMFMAASVTNAIPGIILQLILIPALVVAFRRTKILE